MAKKVAVTYEKGFKTQFVRDALAKRPDSSVNDVNQAWTAAGHDGRLGDTLIYKTKSEIGKSPTAAKTLLLDSAKFSANRLELKSDPTLKPVTADIRDLVIDELRQRIRTASISELIDLLNALGVSSNERSLDPSANGSI